jgi:hypothetical protein
LRCRRCSTVWTLLLTSPPRLLSLWQLSVGVRMALSQRLAAYSMTCYPGLDFQTVNSITRISAVSSAAALAGARIGDALLKVGCTNVWGIPAQQVTGFFVGPAGADGSFGAFASSAAIFTRACSSRDSDSRLQCGWQRADRAVGHADAGAGHSVACSAAGGNQRGRKLESSIAAILQTHSSECMATANPERKLLCKAFHQTRG